MAKRRNRPTRWPAAEQSPQTQPEQPKIPGVPPMQDRRLSWWPLIIVGIIFVLWLIWMAILAANSGRWEPG